MLHSDKIPWFGIASRKKRHLVGVSGGADSVALLHLLVEAGFSNLVVCHLNHGLRGRAAAADAAFVKRLAERLKLPHEIGKADVKHSMASSGDSLETAARNERHRFFADCARKHRSRSLLLAHHADDQAETVLWNLLRGSHGLRGMKEKKSISTESGTTLEIIRPLLLVRREDLVAWLSERKLGWREDATNGEPIAIRNRLRNEALPLLSQISGRDAVAAFARGADSTGEVEELEAWAVEKAAVLDPQGRLHVPALRELPDSIKNAAMRSFLLKHGVTAPSRELVIRCCGLLVPGSPPSVNLPGGKRLRRKEARLWVES